MDVLQPEIASGQIREFDVRAAAHAVLLPAIADTTVTPALERYLRDGGISLLLGETREEYVARAMSAERVANESTAEIAQVAAKVRELASAPTLIAVDEEPGGIRRFAHATADLPLDEGLEALEGAAAEAGRGLREMGVNVALGPIVDVEGGESGWLKGRFLAADAATVGDLGTAFVKGIQAGGVAATPKHFPGHRGIASDPMIDAEAAVPGGVGKLLVDLLPFAAAVEAGCRCLMIGPGTVAALDPGLPALLSPITIELLRNLLGFDGVVVSDDLDAAAILKVADVESTAVTALAAGNDLLLVSAENDLESLASAIVAAVEDGSLPGERLADAAGRVRKLAADLNDVGAAGD